MLEAACHLGHGLQWLYLLNALARTMGRTFQIFPSSYTEWEGKPHILCRVGV